MTEKKLCLKCGSEHIETSIEWISDTEWKVVGTICVECGHEENVGGGRGRAENVEARE